MIPTEAKEVTLGGAASRGLNEEALLKETMTIMSISSKKEQEMQEQLNMLLS